MGAFGFFGLLADLSRQSAKPCHFKWQVFSRKLWVGIFPKNGSAQYFRVRAEADSCCNLRGGSIRFLLWDEPG